MNKQDRLSRFCLGNEPKADRYLMQITWTFLINIFAYILYIVHRKLAINRVSDRDRIR
jgi:hypothetical protein